MKTPQTLFTLLLMLTVSLHAEPQEPTKEALIRLIAAIPSDEELLRDNDLMLHPEKARNEKEAFAAKERLVKAHKAIGELQKLIRLGSSVLDYPGLLANRRIRYTPSGWGYSFYVGTQLTNAEGEPVTRSDKTDRFNVVFDDAGIITMVAFRDRGTEQMEKADVVLYVAISDEIHIQRPDGFDQPFPPAHLAKRVSAASRKRETIVLVLSKPFGNWTDSKEKQERLKQLADDLERPLREIGFKKVIFHFARGDIGSWIYRE